jgi:hypothetical protein
MIKIGDTAIYKPRPDETELEPYKDAAGEIKVKVMHVVYHCRFDAIDGKHFNIPNVKLGGEEPGSSPDDTGFLRHTTMNVVDEIPPKPKTTRRRRGI